MSDFHRFILEFLNFLTAEDLYNTTIYFEQNFEYSPIICVLQFKPHILSFEKERIVSEAKSFLYPLFVTDRGIFFSPVKKIGLITKDDYLALVSMAWMNMD